MRLNQIVDIDKSTKNQCNLGITALYKDIQKAPQFSGISRTYRPKNEDGDKFPSESQKVQRRATEVLSQTAQLFTKYWDITLTKDSANTEAKADVVLDGKVIFEKAPVTFLLFLGKQLTDLSTMLKTIPTLDPGESWKYDAASDTHITPVMQTTKTKKVPTAFVKSPATVQHPAQVDRIDDDQVIGFWDTVKSSGAIPQKDVTDILERIEKLQIAVKLAKQEGNMHMVQEKKIGKAVFDFVLNRS